MGWLIGVMGAGAPPVNPPLPDKPSIVVLPFANMSGDPEQEYFADGITEDLTTELSRKNHLFVISRNSAFTYKGQAVRVEEVGRELGVRYVLEGSVRKAGSRVRITAQLIDAANGFHIWSERYDRDLSDIFALQSALAREIQTAMRVEIRDAEMARARRIGTDDVDAWDAMLRGLYHFERFRRSENLEARHWFARAVELDPEYGSAHAMYGNTHALEYSMGWSRDPALLEAAEAGARRARELGTRTSDVYNTQGNVNLARREFEAAESEFDRAIAAETSHDIPYLLRGVALASQGRILPALESIAHSLRLNPRGSDGQRLVVAFVNYRAGRTAEAVAQLEEARAENPDLILPRLVLIFHRDSEGRAGEVGALAAEVRRINPDLTAEQANEMMLAYDAPEVFRRAGLP
jgi:adenylate cyclase